MITQGGLQELVTYNPNTGKFFWLVNKGRAYAGDEAGYVQPAGRTHYRAVKIDQQRYFAHRLAFLYILGRWPHGEVDHQTGCGLDNWWSNLLDVEHRVNLRNSRMRNNNTSGRMGVVWHKNVGKWMAQIGLEDRNAFLGYFTEYDDAVAARKEGEVKHGFHDNHGEVRTK